jgi:predicted SnoaL-like aldol condensation-catalyzing enzyme
MLPRNRAAAAAWSLQTVYDLIAIYFVIKSETLREKIPFMVYDYEPGVIAADGAFVIVHGRFSGHGGTANWIAADILRIKDGILVKHSLNSHIKRPFRLL